MKLLDWANMNNVKILDEWDYNENKDININEVYAKSSKIVIWKCDKGHKYPMRINKKVSGQQCPFCRNKQLLVGFNDLKSQYPEVASEWDYNKNDDVPENVFMHSHKKVFWKCKKCGLEWETNICYRTRDKRGCPDCSLKKRVESARKKHIKKTGGFANNYQDLLEEWDYEKNISLNPYDFNINSKEKVFWIGKKCGHSWEARITDRVNSRGCPYCSGKKILKGFNDYESQNRELAKEWDYNRNTELPSEVYKNSPKAYYWICCFCGESYIAQPRYKKSSGCRNCINSNSVKKSIQTRIERRGSLLQNEYADLLKDWDYENNSKMGFFPENTTLSSNRSLNWKCHICGYHWKTSIFHRRSGTGCPACSNRVVIKGKNDLATIAPELVEEWDYEKNRLNAYEVSGKSGESYYWECRFCGNVWKASPHNRVAGTNCPKCQGHNTSFYEQTIYYYISKLYEDAINRYIFPDERIEIDIFIPQINVGIEYDGYRFHLNKKENDDRKTKVLKEKGIRLIRVREKDVKGNTLPNLDETPYLILECDVKSKFESLDNVILDIINKVCNQKELLNKIDINSKRDRFIILHQMYMGRHEKSFEQSNSKHLKYWDYTLNFPLKPNELSNNSPIEVNWICDKCGYKWVRTIADEKNSKGCPACNHQIVTEQYNFGILNPEISKEWDYSVNTVSPYEVMPTSHVKYAWICE